VDRRADIWAFGVVLFELLTGERLFDGETVSHTLADVLRAPIDFDVLPGQTPPAIRALLKRCLERDPKLRLRDIGEARVVLAQSMAVEEPVAALGPQSRTPWLVAAVAGVALCAAGFGWWQSTRRVPQPVSRFDVEMGEDFSVSGVDAPHVILSPDGRHIVSQVRGADGKVRLAVRSLEEAKPTVLAGTEGATHPFFAPDGEWIGYHDRQNLALRKVSIRGGAPVTICPLPNLRGASWGEDGTIVFSASSSGGLQRISANGGAPQPLTALDEKKGDRTHRYPIMLPGGKAALFFSSASGGGYENSTIEAVTLATGQRTALLSGGFAPRYSPSGHLLFMRQGGIFAVAFDAANLKVTSTPVAMMPNVRHYSTRGSAEFDVSPAGTLIFIEGQGQSINKPLVLADAGGTKTAVIKDPQEYTNPRFSPDGKRIAFDSVESGKRDIWVYDRAREIKTRLTVAPGEHANAVWTADGERIAFHRAGGIYWVRSGGGGEPEKLFDSKYPVAPVSFSPDGKVLAYIEERPGAARDIGLLEFDLRDPTHPRPGKSVPLMATTFDEREPLFSPDGKWMAYESNESGTNEVYVRSYPDGGGRWQISNGGGFRPRWSPNRKELFFTAAGKMYVVSYSAERSGFVASKPRFWGNFGSNVIGFDISPDGKQILLGDIPEVGISEPSLTRVVFLLNFIDELKRRVP